MNFVERILLNMGFVLHTTNSLEAGIDGFIELRDRATGAASNFFIAVQIKATQQDFLKETLSTFEWVCTQRDLDYWLQGNAPIVLIVVRPHIEEAYWVPIKEYFRDLSNKAKRRIVFDRVRNRFDADCAPQFSRLAVPRDIGVYRGAEASVEHRVHARTAAARTDAAMCTRPPRSGVRTQKFRNEPFVPLWSS
jgi:hypothetical protein